MLFFFFSPLFHLRRFFVVKVSNFFSLFLSFPPVIHCWRRWSKINLTKVYDAINCLHKNLLKIHIVKESKSDIETLSIDRVINKKLFMVKVCGKCAPKTSLKSLFNFGKQRKIVNTCKKEDYQKTFKKLTWFFPLYPVLFYGQDYEKQEGLELVTSLSLGFKYLR